MATVQNNKIEFVIGDKAKISAADAYKLWFDTTHKQMILKGVEFIPKKLSELTNDSGFITAITKAMVEGVLTGTISSHTHAFSSLTSKPTTISGYGITDGVTTSTLNSSLSKYLKLSGGTMTGILYANRAIIAQGRGSNKGYQGYFNNSDYALIGIGSHIFGSGKAQGDSALSFGPGAFAGVRNQDPDKDTYPYLAWQWMNTQPIEVNTTTSSVGGGRFYGYPLLGGEVVEYSTPDGGSFTYENTTQRLQFLLLVKNYDKFVFAGSVTSSEPRNVVCYMFGGMYVLRNYITKVTERVIGDTTYYEVIIHQGSTTALDYTKYNPSNQIRLLCATKCNTDNFSGASSYINGYSALALNGGCRAFGNYSIALGLDSLTTTFCSNAIGSNSVAAAMFANAFGNGSYALEVGSLAFGDSSVARGYMSAAFGQLSITLGDGSMAFSRASVAKGDYSMAFGYRAIANGHYSCNFAYNGISNHPSQSVFGKYNKAEDAALIVGGGNGTADTNRKNIFKVDWSGNVTGKFFSGYSNSVGGEGFKIYPENSNEINFGGIGASPEIIFGKSSKDNRPTPNVYKFGANGDASLIGSSFSGNASTASQLATPRTLTIGNTGKTFDGTADVSWSLEEIGVKDENVKFTTSVDNVDYRLTAIGQRIAGNVEGVNNVVTAEGITMNPSTGNLKATSFTGSLIGNAATATKLSTPQTLWGNSFDGSGSVSGDLTFEASGLTLQASHGMRIGSDYGGFIGFSKVFGISQPDGTIVGGFTGISLGWGANPETDAASVRLNATTFTYKSYPILHSNNFSDYAPTKTGEGASGTWGISISGNADTATALTSSAGSSTQPIYFSNGKPVACSYTLAKSVPSNAVFTDTTYSVATPTADGLMSAAMFNTKKVSSINVRQGAVDWEESISNHDIYVTYNEDNAENNLTHKVGGDVQLKIPNATTDYDGSMSYLDKRKIDSIHNNCVAASVYVMTINYDALLDLNGIKEPTTNFANLDNIMTSGKFPDMIRLVLNNSIHVFTLYESYLNDKYAQYRCEGRKAEISILANNYVLFSIN